MAKVRHNLWYKDAVIYQLHVQTFFDDNNDGRGDFAGLIKKLDYIKTLGVNAIWLLPFYPSPMKDGGYDISDFTGIHPLYGKLSDFKRFVHEAHKRELGVITELVLNHTSNQHKWFEESRKAKPGSSRRNYYVWSDTTDKYNEARIIFQDFETSNWTWDPEAKAYYWHRFYSHQPDLNFDNPAVQHELFKVIDFWFNIGVDGLRLDAVPYLFEREGTNCENLPETHEFLKKLRKYIDEHYTNKMLLAEANQWPEDAVKYFGRGDECHMAFNFPLMPRLYMSMKMEDRFPLVDIMDQTPSIPDSCQWVIFLRNHDELTLEMVSDEERDYMYKSFVQEPEQRINLGIRRRLAPLMENDRRRIEMMNILLLSLPGTPVIYYGDEIGMGDNYYLGDRDGVRTPMQWTADKNAGFSRAKPQQLYLPLIIDYEYHYEALNVESQDRNPSSLLWWMRRAISTRKRYKAFGRGSIKFIHTDNSRVLAFIREYDDEKILVLVNLSRYPQAVSLDLAQYSGYTPVEVFSQNFFPPVTDANYMFTLQQRDYFWFLLSKDIAKKDIQSKKTLPQLEFNSREWNAMGTRFQSKLEPVFAGYIANKRWFRGKSRKIRTITADNFCRFKTKPFYTYLFLIDVEYMDNVSEKYVLPVSLQTGEEAMHLKADFPEAAMTKVIVNNTEGLMYESFYRATFQNELLEHILNRNVIKCGEGEMHFLSGKYLHVNLSKEQLPLQSQILGADQSNTSMLYNGKFFLKIYRSPDDGHNVEIEIIRALTEKTQFRNIPPYAGSIEYYKKNNENYSLGILVGFEQNQGNAWDFAQRFIDRYFENILSKKDEIKSPPSYIPSILDGYDEEENKMLKDFISHFFIEMIEKMGQRTAEMHLGLASITDDVNFNPEAFSLLYQKSVNQSMRTLIKQTIFDLRLKKKNNADVLSTLIQRIFDDEDELLNHVRFILESQKIIAQKTRIHGDYHLGQVLFTGKDFIIIDFEGEPLRTLSARRLKYSPLKDVAGMLRSFHYAIYMGFFKYKQLNLKNEEILKPWLEHWYYVASSHFLKAYLETASGAAFIPPGNDQVENLLQLYLIEKAVYEINYELNNRYDWLIVPLNGLEKILDRIAETENISH